MSKQIDLFRLSASGSWTNFPSDDKKTQVVSECHLLILSRIPIRMEIFLISQHHLYYIHQPILLVNIVLASNIVLVCAGHSSSPSTAPNSPNTCSIPSSNATVEQHVFLVAAHCVQLTAIFRLGVAPLCFCELVVFLSMALSDTIALFYLSPRCIDMLWSQVSFPLPLWLKWFWLEMKIGCLTLSAFPSCSHWFERAVRLRPEHGVKLFIVLIW